ncbi:MAG TPA: fimbrial protein [Scandinavium sp.]|jgi:minor fimbrial subunit|uniref:fimbrial protein n=1 Tax=Scandinavium sp. TaxID=2830653 RepID=UPI002E31F7B1|nr:fimbrial protein [Scandinavium sp.]HEX4503369.1 fimbrial protein [Scandinavium sp.]
MEFRKLVVVIACAFNASAFAADTLTINVSGNVVASPCKVNGGGTSLSVPLGDIQSTTLSAAGTSSTPVAFDLKFTECPAGTNSVIATFTGTADPVAGTSYYQNAGTAKNVAVGLIQVDTGNLKGTGSTITQSVLADRTATMKMQAKAYSSAGGATPGTITSAIVATMTYN